MKLQHGLMALGLVVGVWLVFFSEKNSESDVAEAVVRPGTREAGGNDKSDLLSGPAVVAAKKTGKVERVIPILALTARQALISVGHVGLDGKKLAGTTQIFTTQSWVPPPPPPPDPKLNPPPPPTAPPLRFSFVGMKLEDGVWEVYLAQGDNSYVVRNESVIDATYRVDAITPTSVMLTYLPLNQAQRLNIKGVR